MDWLENDRLTSWFWTMGRGMMLFIAMVSAWFWSWAIFTVAAYLFISLQLLFAIKARRERTIAQGAGLSDEEASAFKRGLNDGYEAGYEQGITHAAQWAREDIVEFFDKDQVDNFLAFIDDKRS